MSEIMLGTRVPAESTHPALCQVTTIYCKHWQLHMWVGPEPFMGHSMSNQRKTNMTPPEFLQIWCGEDVYGITQPHQILS